MFEQRQFPFLGQGHVVFDGVQRPQHEVEHAHGVSQLLWQLLDHHCEAPRDGVEHAITERQGRILGKVLGSICGPFGAHLRVHAVSVRSWIVPFAPTSVVDRTRAVQSPGWASNCATAMAMAGMDASKPFLYPPSRPGLPLSLARSASSKGGIQGSVGPEGREGLVPLPFPCGFETGPPPFEPGWRRTC
eukprot:scaffold431_cov334-Pavlova_lutheri.AAC.72